MSKLSAAAASGDRLEFDSRVFLSVRPAAEELFGGKCAYCESSIFTSLPEIDHFRPIRAAVDLDGETVRPGYWWLAYSWQNIYLVCQQCNRNKGSRFPVLGRRARSLGDNVAAERAILLDPCADEDEPDKHLLFGEDGYVASRSEGGEVDRGAITIDILGLNRAGLVQERRRTAEQLQAGLRGRALAASIIADPRPPDPAFAESFVDISAPYVALQRQVVRNLLDEMTAPATAAERTHEREQVFMWQAAHEEDLRRTSVEDDPDLESLKSQRISRVEIENFRGIRRLGFDLGAGTAGAAGWTTLIGENGVGKTSVLQALAIALMGEERARSLGSDATPADLLRRGSRNGSIRVFFAADSEPIEVHLSSERIEFGESTRRPRMIVLGFGSSRWLPRPGALTADHGEFIRVANLFNPFVPLSDTLRWLATLADRDFRRTEAALLRLLRLDAGERLTRIEGRVLVRRQGQRAQRALPLQQLSDGYQTVLAMVGDIMELLSPKRLDMAAAEGVVLVDELEAHLHPRWKMQIVSRLRTAFPGLQFVTSTHDPLCLRGLHEGEVVLLLRDRRGEIVATSELPSVEALRVDQLLTSPYFGLHSTRDPDVDARFDEYYDLLARRRLTKTQRERLEELRTELDTRQLLGTDRRENLMLEAIDKHLANEADALAAHKDELLSESTAQKLSSILDRLDQP